MPSTWSLVVTPGHSWSLESTFRPYPQKGLKGWICISLEQRLAYGLVILNTRSLKNKI